MTRALIPLLAAALLAPATASADPSLPAQLPGEASAAGASADRSDWLVGGRPGAATAALAQRYGARRVGVPGTGGYAVPTARARAFAGALRRRGALVYAQPDVPRERAAVADDPLSGPPNAWRRRVVDPAIDPPPVTPQSPLIALVDATLDPSHPEFAGGNVRTLGGLPVTNLHGTATAAVAAAPKNGVGILGVWPGARALNVPLPDTITCRQSADQITRAVEAGAAVINMSYGSKSLCIPEYVALQFATGRGVVLVAAAGNEFAEGNPLEFPASLPHVLTVAATGPDGKPAYFSSASAAVDLAAPGVNILTAVPPAFDEDGVRDGYEALSGTSFAAPMVAAAAAWVRADRPGLQASQIAQVLRLSASDIAPSGWDPSTGFGQLNIGAALHQAAPANDSSEPNDNLVWVNGRFFKPDRLIWDGSRRISLTASVSRFEDPADVYRIRIPARRTVHASVSARFGDVDLAVYSASAQSLNDTKRRVARSAHRGRATERVAVRNRAGARRTFYVAVTPRTTSHNPDSSYTLRLR